MIAGTADGPGRLGSAAAAITSFVDAAAAQARVVGLLALREVKGRFSKSIFAGIASLLEPAIHILFLYMIYYFLLKEVRFGSSLLLFLATGFVPFCLFTGISTGATSAVRQAKSLRAFSVVTPLDFVLATALVEIVSLSLIYGTLIYALSFWEIYEAVPHAPGKILGALSAIILLALGVGMFNSGIAAFFPGWKTIYGRAARIFMITSGVHRVVEYVPEYYRQYMLYNPMLHAIEWFRSGFYLLYPTYSLDLTYLWTWAIAAFVLGLAFERVVHLHFAHLRKRR